SRPATPCSRLNRLPGSSAASIRLTCRRCRSENPADDATLGTCTPAATDAPPATIGYSDVLDDNDGLLPPGHGPAAELPLAGSAERLFRRRPFEPTDRIGHGRPRPPPRGRAAIQRPD